ncbi:unnamed protein product [Adineta ricciae]|nr:unnamed protein product [Adineta ricciae]
MICSSIINVAADGIPVIIRSVTDFYGNNLYVTNQVVCKVRPYLLFCFPSTASTCFLLGAFDRCVSTSPHARWRQLSSIPFAKRLFTTIMVFLCTSSVFHMIVFDLRDGTCAPPPGLLSIITTVYNLVFMSIIPDGGTFIFGIVTYIHMHRSKRRITARSETSSPTIANQRVNRQLLILVFAQATIGAVIGALRSSAFAYNLLTSSVKKSVERQQIETLIQQASLILFYYKFALPFYISYGTSSMFRKTFHKSMQPLVNRCLNFCKCRQTQTKLFS